MKTVSVKHICVYGNVCGMISNKLDNRQKTMEGIVGGLHPAVDNT